MQKIVFLSGFVSILVLCLACEAPPQEDQDKGPGEMASGKSDQWGPLDNPAKLNKNLIYRLESLPLEGEASRIPWPGSYWPTYQDSINQKWDGADSMPPSVKYGKAFDLENFDDKISSLFGVDRYSYRKSCTKASDCVGTTGTCGKRDGEDVGRCIPTWWGICHAWSPAAIKEPEPKYPVVRNGVTFKVNDIKALMTLVYHYVEDKHISLRCETKNGTDMAVDPYGNPTGDDIGCKDTNPGTFHVVATNYLGLMKKSFVEDRTYDLQVWNQPVARYRVTHQEPVSIAEAHALLNIPPDHSTEAYLFNEEAKSLYHVKMELDYVVESNAALDGYLSHKIESYIHTDAYEYILELDGEGNIFGGEWVGSSKTKHPDFLWVPTQIKTNGHWEPPISYWKMKSILEESLSPPTEMPVDNEDHENVEETFEGTDEEIEEPPTPAESYVDEDEGDEEDEEDEDDYDEYSGYM